MVLKVKLLVITHGVLNSEKLLELASQGKTIRKEILFGPKPLQNDSLWKATEGKMVEVVVKDKNYQNKEETVDTKLMTIGAKLIYKTEPAVLKILSDDSDFISLVKLATAEGRESKIWIFTSVLNSCSLFSIINKVEPLDDHMSEIRLGAN